MPRLEILPQKKLAAARVETPKCLDPRQVEGCYSERRKFNRFCLFAADKALKFAITVLASDPVLACAAMAVSRFFVRPSCRKKMRCPRPHSGDDRNWSPPALPWETLSFRPVPM